MDLLVLGRFCLDTTCRRFQVTVSKQELHPELQTSVRTLQCGTLFLLASSSSSEQAQSSDDILSPIIRTHATLVSE